MKSIYLDYAATTPPDKEVCDAIYEQLNNNFGNPSSTHAIGQSAAFILDNARESVSKLLNCSFSEITFTSGATESNNLLILGCVKAFKKKYVDKKGHIIVSSIEHPSVLEVAKYLKEEGIVDVDFANVDQDGIVDMDHLFSLLRDDTFLISVMYVNNEIGSIQPIRDIGKKIEKLNKERDIPLLFHTDATQGINYLSMDVLHLHVHALSFSSHKMYGPKGVGVLYLSNNYSILPLLYGGSQEWSLRSGTINVPLIAGLNKAVQRRLEKDLQKENEKLNELKSFFISEIKKEIPDLIINGVVEKTTPSHIHLSFPSISGENLFMCLDMQGVCVSLGSACAAGKVDDSYVLSAMGIDKSLRRSSIRVTLGAPTTKEELKDAVSKISFCHASLK